MKWGGDPVTLS